MEQLSKLSHNAFYQPAGFLYQLTNAVFVYSFIFPRSCSMKLPRAYGSTMLTILSLPKDARGIFFPFFVGSGIPPKQNILRIHSQSYDRDFLRRGIERIKNKQSLLLRNKEARIKYLNIFYIHYKTGLVVEEKAKRWYTFIIANCELKIRVGPVVYR